MAREGREDELTEEEEAEKGYLETWRKLEGKNIKRGEVKLQLNWLQFKTDAAPVEQRCAFDINRYFLGAFVNSLGNLPDSVRGRQVQVELTLSDHEKHRAGDKKAQSQITHPAVAPDCSFAETKWFFLTSTEKSSLSGIF